MINANKTDYLFIKNHYKIIRLGEEVYIEKYPDEFRMVVYENFAIGNLYGLYSL